MSARAADTTSFFMGVLQKWRILLEGGAGRQDRENGGRIFFVKLMIFIVTGFLLVCDFCNFGHHVDPYFWF